MHKIVSSIVLILFFLIKLHIACAQTNTSQFDISTSHPIEPVAYHYDDLQTYSPAPNTKRAWMDTLAYPPDMYGGFTMISALAAPVYLTTNQVNFLKKSVKFPANSSDQTRAELDFLLELQEKRTPEESERVMEIARVGFWPHINAVPTHPSYERNLHNLFYECREVVGEDCTASNYPHTSHLLEGAMNDMRLIEFATKFEQLRARPYQLDDRLDPLTRINTPSFASGHTLWAYVQAYIFSELIPEKRQAFLDIAYEVGYSREVLGVHYPSDEEAARQLSHRMIHLMWHTEKFQEDLMKAKEEWE